MFQERWKNPNADSAPVAGAVADAAGRRGGVGIGHPVLALELCLQLAEALLRGLHAAGVADEGARGV